MAVVTSVRLLPPLRAQRIEARLLPIRATPTADRVGVKVGPGGTEQPECTMAARCATPAWHVRGGAGDDGNSLPSGGLNGRSGLRGAALLQVDTLFQSLQYCGAS